MRSNWTVSTVFGGRGRRTPTFAVLLTLLLGLTGCVFEDDDDAPTDAPVATRDAAQGSGADGCWTEDQRTTDLNGKPQWTSSPAMVIDTERTYTAQFETSLGSFSVELFPREAPMTVNSFVCLARSGYFDDIVFHRVIAGFVVQGGDPTGTGQAGPGYSFEDELPTTLNYDRGTLAMANAGPNTNGSQFFVCLTDLSSQLQKAYSIFGRVSEGIETVDAIAAVEVGIGGDGQPSSPLEPVTMTSVAIVEN